MIKKEKVFRLDHVLILIMINNLDNLYNNQDKLDQTKKIYIRVLTGYKKILEPDHILTFRMVNNLGNLYGDQDKLKQIKKLFEQVRKNSNECF